MKTSDFYYDLPQELIAQTPIEPRDQSRLMVVDKNTGEVTHKIFKDLIDYLNPNDCLILNDTRVIPARIYGVKKETGAVVEFLLLKQSENNVWECLCKPGKRAKIGTEFVFGEGLVECEVVDITDDGNRKIQFKCDSKEIYTILDKIGKMPLPPYITEELKNGERYQTVYSRELGSAAAPTAGLHFTNELLEQIQKKGIDIASENVAASESRIRDADMAKTITEHVKNQILQSASVSLLSQANSQSQTVLQLLQ